MGAADADGGAYPLVTSASETKLHSTYSFDNEAICVPIVSATGHGHASIKNVHYIKGKFEAATIVAVLIPKSKIKFSVTFVHAFLSAYKEEPIVSLMRGAANVSLSLERLGRIRIPLPPSLQQQQELIADIAAARNDVSNAMCKLKLAKEQVGVALENFRNVV